jgi:hypothetical protein
MKRRAVSSTIDRGSAFHVLRGRPVGRSFAARATLLSKLHVSVACRRPATPGGHLDETRSSSGFGMVAAARAVARGAHGFTVVPFHSASRRRHLPGSPSEAARPLQLGPKITALPLGLWRLDRKRRQARTRFQFWSTRAVTAPLFPLAMPPVRPLEQTALAISGDL